MATKSEVLLLFVQVVAAQNMKSVQSIIQPPLIDFEKQIHLTEIQKLHFFRESTYCSK